MQHVHVVQIYGKAEMLNPGGSVKDRVALQIMQEAFTSGRLKPGGLITEGTAGSTGKDCLPKHGLVLAGPSCHTCRFQMPPLINQGRAICPCRPEEGREHSPTLHNSRAQASSGSEP